MDPLFHLAFFGFRPPHLLHLQRNQDNRDKECDTICDRSSKEDSVDPEKQRQNQYQRNQEKHLPGHGKQQALQRLPNSRKEIGGDQLYTVYDNHK